MENTRNVCGARSASSITTTRTTLRKSIMMDEEVNGSQETSKARFMKKTVLDSFTKLTSDKERVRIKAGINVLKYLTSKESNEITPEQNYAFNRIIRGLGSSQVAAKTGFYSVFVALLTNGCITVEYVLESIKSHLSTGGSFSKGENADIIMGRILSCGGLIHSGMFMNASTEEQSKILEILVTAGKKRSYLALAAYTFLVELLDKMDEECFSNVLWPIMKNETSKPWTEQTLETIYFLCLARDKFPSTVKSKFVKKLFEAPEIIHEDCIKPLCNLLFNLPMTITIKHPIYNYVGRKISSSNFILEWCAEMEKQLLKPTRNKHLIVTLFLTLIIGNINESESIPHLFTPQFMKISLNTFKNTQQKNKDDEFVHRIDVLFDTLHKRLLKDDVTDETKISVLKKLLIDPGSFNFEKITKSKLINHITLSLNREGIEQLSELYKEVIVNRTTEGSRNWVNADRACASHLLVKVLAHSTVLNEKEWRLEHLKFLLKLGMFKDGDTAIGLELAATLKENFYRALDQKFPKLEDLRSILSSLVHYTNDKLLNNPSVQIRSPLSVAELTSWSDMMALVSKLESKTKLKQSYAIPVFHTLLLHMGLQLFVDPELSKNALRELHSCFERIDTKKAHKNKSKGDVDDSEPDWVEVMVDLFLNLLSHNSHLLRNIINCVFPHLCVHLTLTAIHQILDVLHSSGEDNPLTNYSESEDDEEDEQDEESEEGNEESEKGSDESEEESEDSGVDDDEVDKERETVSDKLRMAVREALGKLGYESDDQSVDVDDIDEDEANRLNSALAEAFKSVKKQKINKNKQTKDDKTLTHFRLRVLDLIEIYLESELPMLHCLEIAIPLLHVLEFTIRDEHQKPLENRVRSCLKKLSAIKKFSNTEGVTDRILIDLLNSFLDKGSKSAFIYQDMGEEISDCCVFVLRCSQLLHAATESSKKTKQSAIIDIFKSSLETYFKKRNCLLPVVLFKSVLQQNWEGNLVLLPLLVDFAFNSDIRPFRRNQALELLQLFYSNSRFITANFETFKDNIGTIEQYLSEKSIELLNNLSNNPKECKVKEKFVCNLLQLLKLVKDMKGSENVNWDTIGTVVREYRSHTTLAKDAKGAYNKLCQALGIPNLVKINTNLKVREDNDDEHSDEGPQPQATDEADKRERKKKKPKLKSNDIKKLKKEAQMLRLQAGAVGLANVNFSNFELNNINVEVSASDSETEPKQEKSKKVKINGTHQNNKSANFMSKKKRSISESSDKPIKKKHRK